MRGRTWACAIKKIFVEMKRSSLSLLIHTKPADPGSIY